MSIVVVGLGLAPDGPVELPGPVPWARYLTPEAAGFVFAGSAAAAGSGARPADRVSVVCATHRAGLGEYVQTYRSGRDRKDRAANPVRGPQSSANSPASHLSLQLGLQGPVLTLAGATGGGIGALERAATLLATGRADLVLAGGVDRPDASAPAVALGRAPSDAALPHAVVLALSAGLPPGAAAPTGPAGPGSPARAVLPGMAVLAGVASAVGGAPDEVARRALAVAGLTAADVEPAGPPATGAGATAGVLAVARAVQRIRPGDRPVLCVAADPDGPVAAVVVTASAGAP